MSFDLKKVKVPTARDRVNKEDCTFCFKSIESEGGLFVDLQSFVGVCTDHLLLHYERTNDTVYLNITRTRTLKPVEHKEGDAQKRKAVVLGIGMEGGFEVEDEKRWDVKDVFQVVSYPSKHTNVYPDPNLPMLLSQSIEAVIKADTASKKDEVKSMELTEKAMPSKFVKDLKQLDNGVKVPRHGWKCTHCDLTENLWMNLTDGTILCGRRNFDGSGGNNHAVEYYGKTGFPLAVKLGTITAQGTADVYSYPEDIMVDDPILRQHLAHFGINMMEMEKTDKTLAEMNVDLNNNYEWSRMNEAGKKLTPLFGPGYTGMRNIGNSCYLNSVSQVLFALPSFQDRYFNKAAQVFRQAPQDPTQDFTTQMSKLAEGLLSGRFSVPAKNSAPEATEVFQDGVVPKMFKSVVGANHPEFQTGRQQDALEFFQHMITLVERAERNSPATDPSRVFKMRVEERVECSISHKVKYSTRMDNSLSLPIPTERASNAAEYAAYEKAIKEKRAKQEPIDPRAPAVRPVVTLQACLEAWAAQEVVHAFYSSAAKARVDALKSSRLASFPEVLCIHMRKFVLDGWVPRKLDALVDAPEEIDLSAFRAKGLQANEQALNDEPAPLSAAPPAQIVANQDMVSVVMDMGFPRNRAEKAVVSTNNAGAEEAMNWLLAHMDDADIDVPLPTPTPTPKASAPVEALNEEGISMLMSMGFTRDQAAKALRATGNNVERATDWIFSHVDELNSMDTTSVVAAPVAGDVPAANAALANAALNQVSDGSGKYRLMAFVSHVGSNTSSGHYVCHIRKDGRWVAFDDAKVGASELLPKDLAYLYFYARI